MSVKRWLSLAVAIPILTLAACTPAAPATPTQPPAPKPAEPAPAAPAPKPAEPAAKPAAPAPKPAEPAPKPAEPDYFAGKTITLLAGSSAGGGTDTLVRLIGQHLGRFIPGNPTVIVQNVPGAGGMNALNQMVNSAPPDGLTFNGSISNTLFFAQILEEPAVRYDLTEVTWIGGAYDDAQVLWVRSETPYTDIDAIRNAATPPRLGAQSGTHSSVVLPKIVEEITGLEFNVITGYPGSPEIFLDVEREALDGRFASYGSLKTQRPHWIEEQFIRILMFSGAERHEDLPDVPSITELIPPERERLQALVLAPQQVNRSMAGPPGIPDNIAQIVRDAYAEMARDPQFRADTERAGFDYGYTPPDQLAASVRELMEDQDMKTALTQILAD